MESGLNNLRNLFARGIYRIPDYQRGYAWGNKEVEDFWEDLFNLAAERQHYGGVITLEEIPEDKVDKNETDSWFLSKINKTPYYIVDGQQRLTTAMLLLKVIIEVAKSSGVEYLNEFDSISEIEKEFIVLKRDADNVFYLPFSYETDNDSYGFYISKILELKGSEDEYRIFENKYSDNLQHAFEFFKKKVEKLKQEEVDVLYTKLVHKLVFNRYVIDSNLDIHVTFETMNNRGRILSTLELLKNRLIYLTTLYTEIPPQKRIIVKNQINDVWKIMYRSIGEIEHSETTFNWPMSRYRFYSLTTDDIFLNAQLTAYPTHKFKNYLDPDEQKMYEINTLILRSENLLKNIFTSQNVIQKKLKLKDIQEYIQDLKLSIRVWRDMQLTVSSAYDTKTKEYLSRINFLTLINFRNNRLRDFVIPKEIPIDDIEVDTMEELFNSIAKENIHPFYETQSIAGLVQKFIFKLLKTESTDFLPVLKNIEKFLFLDSFIPDSNELRYDELDRKKRLLQFNTFVWLCCLDRQHNITEEILNKFNLGMIKIHKEYIKLLPKSYDILSNTQIYSDSPRLSYYILTQYNLELMTQSKESFDELDRLCFYFNKKSYNIEHIYPRNHRFNYWNERFGSLNLKDREKYKNTLGNLIVISARKNDKLENKAYPDKCDFKATNNPTGYKYGTMAERYLCETYSDWTKESIYKRGLEILEFMYKEWGVKVPRKDAKKVLGLPEE